LPKFKISIKEQEVNKLKYNLQKQNKAKFK
jgi:hypothetical protein